MIRLSHVHKIYQTEEMETRALDDVTLSIDAGEFVAIMGPSGCGKSTLLNILGMIDRPTGGQYDFAGQQVSCLSESRLVEFRKRNIGFVFQSFNLIGDLTVEENIELPLLYQSVAKAERRLRVREVMELVGLETRARHRPAQLSGGQQQRVAVARAVVGDPKLILADEPTGNLDSQNGEEVMEMLETLNEQGTTIVMVTHSPSHGARAGRVINVLDGKVVPDVHVAL
ncbi:ABC transporter ATP-binding protein [Telmatospirillum sp.]|uniref:ABC transporter ATP-binding protein n=1 Tax=Telmatospirillum sp. TaxID=2079197 RepID=UPI00283CF1B4|nr:ABC transporter ATP-binding protein [Telmatospirillum sp.]MDR3441323.1 ABC transporter ATP-binding protein [Telmatospirillum sp.]